MTEFSLLSGLCLGTDSPSAYTSLCTAQMMMALALPELFLSDVLVTLMPSMASALSGSLETCGDVEQPGDGL